MSLQGESPRHREKHVFGKQVLAVNLVPTPCIVLTGPRCTLVKPLEQTPPFPLLCPPELFQKWECWCGVFRDLESLLWGSRHPNSSDICLKSQMAIHGVNCGTDWGRAQGVPAQGSVRGLDGSGGGGRRTARRPSGGRESQRALGSASRLRPLCSFQRTRIRQTLTTHRQSCYF